MPIVRIADRYLLEPLIRRMFPEPRHRRVAAHVVRKGTSDLRFLCLAGAFCADTASSWADWIAELSRRFPEADIAVVNGFYFYWPDEVGVMRQMIAEGEALLADEQATVIIGFSFGGLLAKAMATQAGKHDVRAIVTLATEHRGHLPRIAETRDVRLGVPMDVDVPTYSFGGWLDMIVWPWTTFTDRSRHRFLATGHFAFMRSEATRAVILAALDDIVGQHYER